jgi:hypothetical protein
MAVRASLKLCTVSVRAPPELETRTMASCSRRWHEGQERDLEGSDAARITSQRVVEGVARVVTVPDDAVQESGESARVLVLVRVVVVVVVVGVGRVRHLSLSRAWDEEQAPTPGCHASIAGPP